MILSAFELPSGLIRQPTQLLLQGDITAADYDAQRLKPSPSNARFRRPMSPFESCPVGSSIRDLETGKEPGTRTWIVQNAIARGIIPGPRMQVATRSLESRRYRNWAMRAQQADGRRVFQRSGWRGRRAPRARENDLSRPENGSKVIRPEAPRCSRTETLDIYRTFRSEAAGHSRLRTPAEAQGGSQRGWRPRVQIPRGSRPVDSIEPAITIAGRDMRMMGRRESST